MRSAPTILLSSGELSGDLHAAQLVRRIKEKLPDARVLAFAGDRCREAGAELLFHYNDYDVLGVTGVLAGLPRFLSLERSLKAYLNNGVDLFIPVDYPGLNLRLAAYARPRGVPVLYYISPQVWAWGRGRMAKIARTVDRMAVILPFEVEMYRRRGISAEFVGHPLVVDHELPEPLPDGERDGVGLLPGSRSQEVKRILPALVESAKRMREADAGLRFAVAQSPSVPDSLYREILSATGVEARLGGDAVEVMRRSRLLLVASGTATLQGALLKTPLVIVYRASAMNYFLGRRLVKIPHIGLVNVVLGEAVCPEFIQSEAVPERIVPAAKELLEDGPRRSDMVGHFEKLRRMLAGGRGCKRVAEIAVELLESG
jgi:lipid-A-disaccharide synthase